MAFQKALLLALMGFFLAACEEETETFPRGEPHKRVGGSLRGYKVPNNVIMGSNLSFYWAQQALSNFRNVADNDLPGAIEIMPVNQGCQFPLPETADKIAHVQIGYSNVGAPVYAFTDKSIHHSAVKFIEKYVKDKGRKPKLKNTHRRYYANGHKMGIVNVVIMEHTNPVYLVLTSQASVIWNIQKHVNTRISRVAIIAGGNAGIANLGPEVPVTALVKTRLKGCNAQVHRMPLPHWSFYKNSSSGNYKDKILLKNIKDANDYSRWFVKSFSQNARKGAVGDFVVGHVLVGPIPASLEARIPYKPLKGATLKLTTEDHVFASPNKYYRAEYTKLVEAEANRLANGSLQSLLPKN